MDLLSGATWSVSSFPHEVSDSEGCIDLSGPVLAMLDQKCLVLIIARALQHRGWTPVHREVTHATCPWRALQFSTSKPLAATSSEPLAEMLHHLPVASPCVLLVRSVEAGLIGRSPEEIAPPSQIPKLNRADLHLESAVLLSQPNDDFIAFFVFAFYAHLRIAPSLLSKKREDATSPCVTNGMGATRSWTLCVS